jgi:predicted DNA-binding transcriptional regulator YafY
VPDKWDEAKPAEKLLSLYSLLMISRRKLSLTELSSELKCSKQAVLRLITQLEASRCGKVILSKQGRENMYRLDRPKEIPKLSLTSDGIRELAMCRNFLCHVLPPDIRKSLDSTIRQASVFVPEGIDPTRVIHLGRAAIRGRIDYTPFAETLETLIKAISDRRICDVTYRPNLKGPVKKYAFAPKQLTAFHEALYVDGWMLDKKDQSRLYDNPALLAVHRFQSVEISGRSSSKLPGIEQEEIGFGLIGEPFKAKIKFSSEASTYVAEREWSLDEEKIIHNDGTLTLSLTAKSSEELISWILSFGDRATVLFPKWLRREVMAKIENLLNNYSKD